SGDMWACLSCCGGPLFAVFLIQITWVVGRATRQHECTVTLEQFKIRTRSLLGWLTWIWERRDVEAVGAWNGLWVVAADRRECLCQERVRGEVLWLASVLQALLGVPESVRPGPKELAVVFWTPEWGVERPGLLLVVPGRMTLAHGFATKPVYPFRAS